MHLANSGRRPAPILHVVGLFLALGAGGGCLIVPETTKRTRTVSTRWEESRGPRRLDVRAQLRSGAKAALTLAATWRGTCWRRGYALIETSLGKEAGLGSFDFARGDGVNHRLGVFALLLAPITMPVSGVITAIEVATDEPTRSKHEQLVHDTKKACTGPAARQPVTLTMGSGATFELATDARGELAMPIPASEPTAGRVRVEVAGAKPMRLRYYADRASCDASRLAIFVAATAGDPSGWSTGARGRLARLRGLPSCPGAAPSGLDRREERAERMWQRSRDAVIAAIAEHDCDASLRIAAEVAHLDPVHHASVLGAVSAIAACRAERDASLAERRNAEEARKADRRACLAVRAAIGRRAQTIADISRRVALLRTMPACPAD